MKFLLVMDTFSDMCPRRLEGVLSSERGWRPQYGRSSSRLDGPHVKVGSERPGAWRVQLQSGSSTPTAVVSALCSR
jgi:hypothetical protein